MPNRPRRAAPREPRRLLPDAFLWEGESSVDRPGPRRRAQGRGSSTCSAARSWCRAGQRSTSSRRGSAPPSPGPQAMRRPGRPSRSTGAHPTRRGHPGRARPPTPTRRAGCPMPSREPAQVAAGEAGRGSRDGRLPRSRRDCALWPRIVAEIRTLASVSGARR